MLSVWPFWLLLPYLTTYVCPDQGLNHYLQHARLGSAKWATAVVKTNNNLGFEHRNDLSFFLKVHRGILVVLTTSPSLVAFCLRWIKCVVCRVKFLLELLIFLTPQSITIILMNLAHTNVCRGWCPFTHHKKRTLRQITTVLPYIPEIAPFPYEGSQRQDVLERILFFNKCHKVNKCNLDLTNNDQKLMLLTLNLPE